MLAQGRLPYAPRGKGKPAFLGSQASATWCVAWADGYAAVRYPRFNADPGGATRFGGEADTSLTDPRFLIGRSTLLAGIAGPDARLVPGAEATSLTSDGQHLVMAHEWRAAERRSPRYPRPRAGGWRHRIADGSVPCIT